MLNNGSLKVAKVVKFHANMRMVELNNGNSAPMEIYALQLAKKNNLKGSIHYSFHYDVRINSDRFFIIGMEWMDGWILLHDYLLSNPDLCDDDRKTLWLNNVENGKELYNIGLYHGDVKRKTKTRHETERRFDIYFS